MGVALLVVLASLVGAHVALVAGLLRRRAWWRAVAATFVAPLAPWWGYQAGMRVRSFVWLGAVGSYAAGLAFV